MEGKRRKNRLSYARRSSRESLDDASSDDGESSVHEIAWKSTEPTDEIQISGPVSGSNDDNNETKVPQPPRGSDNRASSPSATATATAGGEKSASDLRKLRSATLDRMGKMLKLHSRSADAKPESSSSTCSTAGNDEELTKKQKYNSLSRLLRLNSDNGSGKPNKEPSADPSKSSSTSHHGLSSSFAKILGRGKSAAEGDLAAAVQDGKPDERVQGIFSKLMRQIKGRNSKIEVTELKNIDQDMLPGTVPSPICAEMSNLTITGIKSCPVQETET